MSYDLVRCNTRRNYSIGGTKFIVIPIYIRFIVIFIYIYIFLVVDFVVGFVVHGSWFMSQGCTITHLS